MKVRWLEDAVTDLEYLRDYIAIDDDRTADKVMQKVLETVSLLSMHPEIGREGRVLNTRELIISGSPYIVPYRVKQEFVDILRILHSAMQWPNQFKH